MNSQSKKYTIIKIGGSCFSDKNEPRSLHFDVIDGICKQIQQLSLNPIIIHGGGSFGHPLAKRYRIHEGRVEGVKDQDFGFSRTHEAMMQVNHEIVKRFLALGLKAFPVQPSSIFSLSNGTISRGTLDAIEGLLDEGFIPVLYGDAVLDDVRHFGILSGDSIIIYLANHLNKPIDGIIFLLDVEGVFDKNPVENDDAILIRNIVIKGKKLLIDVNGVLKPLEGNISTKMNSIDVTGGLLFKLNQLVNINRGLEVSLINGHEPGAIRNLVNGSLEQYTRVSIEK
ncbi:MAG: isopentenyl phosphate kinase [Promethearchaeota archaeon]